MRWHKNPEDEDFIPSGPEWYKKGSFHNKLGMGLMWIFFGIVIVQVGHAMTVLPFSLFRLQSYQDYGLFGMLLGGQVHE